MRELQGEKLGSRNSGLERSARKLGRSPLGEVLAPYSPKRLEVVSQQLAWGIQAEDHIPCWTNTVAILNSFRTMDKGIATWGEEGLTSGGAGGM
jgi:hypothetical protein